ncbi:hypothetical protein GZ77_26280 [Endozoicomonas montiporae]|uniref:Uncharacterized protein n=1 Tax=Endozoicomonas montiporae TaxID=1027273 RepID=A0A081MYI9_9GAMM|nr:WYL domain-containing protein [Endozoicomonas montiporae]KEQ11262.1 hypothetical protein GZ77_26280 [Endozoicomonas montiporae]
MKDIYDLPKNVYDRLEYLEFMLRFRGWITRTELMDHFSISQTAATRDIALYREHRQNNCYLNQKNKRHEYNQTGFKPLFEVDSRSALSKLREFTYSKALGLSDSDGILSPPRLTYPDINLLPTITRAIATKSYLRADYTSVRNGASEKRLLPHAIFDNGIHWYVRAYDEERERHCSLALTRFISAEVTNKVDEAKFKTITSRDHQWNRIITLEIVPHPNDEFVKESATIEHDFGMKDGCLKVQARAIVAGYWLNLWDVDCSANHSLKDKHYQLWLRNHPALYGVDGNFIAPGYKDSYYQ